MASEHVVVWVNGTAHAVRGAHAALPLSVFLRSVLHLTGTKVACGTGDCGACTVLVASPRAEGVWTPVNACIRYVFQLHGCHVLTIEGLGTPAALAPAQCAVVAQHASQCGFCTPGIVLSMTAAVHNRRSDRAADDRAAGDRTAGPEAIDWPTVLSGNLCRCTGYQAVLDAAATFATESEAVHPARDWLSTRLPDAAWRDDGRRHDGESLEVRIEHASHTHLVKRGASVQETLEYLHEHPEAVIVGGATDFGVEQTGDSTSASRARDRRWLAIDHLAELQLIREEAPDANGRRMLDIGAGVRWSALQQACDRLCPPLANIIARVGSPQIRDVGTIGGNIMTASPIADLMPALLVMDAEVVLTSVGGSRCVPVTEFVTGYRTVDRRADELLTAVRLPLLRTDEVLRLTKVSRRLDLDIATVALAVRWREVNGTLDDVAIAVGGMGPTATRLTQTERALQGQPATDASWAQAATQANRELTPRSDVRGAAAYRQQVLHNLLAFVHTDAHAEARAEAHA